VTAGKTNGALQVAVGSINTGGAGKTTPETTRLTPQAPVPSAPANVLPQSAVKTYLASKEWQPGVEGTMGELVNAPTKSILYSTVKPGTAGTFGRVNAVLQVLGGDVRIGADGKITTLTGLLIPHAPGPIVVTVVEPHAADNTYLAVTVWHPGVVVLGEAEYNPPSILNSTLNPETAETTGRVNIAAQVFAGSVMAGAAGNTTALIALD